jgi:hypothetical protein
VPPRILLYAFVVAAGAAGCGAPQAVSSPSATAHSAPPPAASTSSSALVGRWHNVDWPRPAAVGDTSSWQDLTITSDASGQSYHLEYTNLDRPACEECPRETAGKIDGTYTIANDTITLDGKEVLRFALQGDQLTLDVVTGGPPDHFHFQRR